MIPLIAMLIAVYGTGRLPIGPHGSHQIVGAQIKTL